MKINLLILITALGTLIPADGQIVVFSFDGAAGNEASFAADLQPAGGTVSLFSRGSGLSASSGADTFSASGWTTSSSLGSDDYFTFSITPNSGYQLSLSSLSLDERRSGTGIRNWSVRSSLDGFASDLGSFSVPDDIQTRSGQTTLLNNAFQNLISGVEFRLYGFAAEGSGGTWRVDNVAVQGSFSAVPEPHEYAMVAGLALVIFAAWHRRHKAGGNVSKISKAAA